MNKRQVDSHSCRLHRNLETHIHHTAIYEHEISANLRIKNENMVWETVMEMWGKTMANKNIERFLSDNWLNNI